MHGLNGLGGRRLSRAAGRCPCAACLPPAAELLDCTLHHENIAASPAGVPTAAALLLARVQGDTFPVRGGMRTVEFKVVETDPAEYCSELLLLWLASCAAPLCSAVRGG